MLGDEHLSRTTSIAQGFSRWYMAEAVSSLSRLSTLVGRNIDATEGAIELVDSWMWNTIAAEPFVEPAAPVPIALEAKGINIELPGNSFAITHVGWTVIFDVGIAFALTLMNRCSALEWRTVLPKGKVRKVVDVDTGLPALYGFNSTSVHRQPQRIVHVVALKYIAREVIQGELARALHVWEQQCPRN